MLVRSSIKRLATSLCYPLSSKKTTEQWRKPIEQLKKQKQQATPIPADADQKKKAAMQFYEKQYFSKHKEPSDGTNQPQERKFFKKKFRNQPQTKETQTQSKSKIPEVNWLEKNAFKENKQFAELMNEALNMSRLKYFPELKSVLEKIKIKFNETDYDHALYALFKQNFTQTYESFKDLGIEITKLSPKVVSTVIFTFAHEEEYGKLNDLLKKLKGANFCPEFKPDEFYELLFFKETSQDVPFEYGQNSVKISLHNSTFVQKLEIVENYRSLAGESERKKRGRKGTVLPLWLNQCLKIVSKYRFGRKQMRKILTSIIEHEDHMLTENFLQTEQFSRLAREFYFGHQKGLKVILSCIERFMNKNVKFSAFYNNFTRELMFYRAENGKPAFEVDEELIAAYKRGFELNKKHLSIMAATIASDAKYLDLAEHYIRFYVQGFPNETLSSEDTKFLEAEVMNNFNAETQNEKRQKLVNRMTKQGQSLLIRIKSSIKLGNLTQAFRLFQEETYKPVVIERVKKNIEYVLRNHLSEEQNSSYLGVKQINDFLDNLDDQYFWSLHQRSEDLGAMLQKYLPEDKFSFWEEQQKKQFFQEISSKHATGYLDTIKQPPTDILATGFNFQEYLNTEFPRLRELETEAYEKQKEIIKYKLRVEGLIEYQKVHSDDLVIEKLDDFLKELSEDSLKILEKFGLRDYDIKEWGWDEYVTRFNKMKVHDNELKDERLDWRAYYNHVKKNKNLANKQIIEELMIKAPQVFKEAEALVKLNESPIVNKLLLWGVYTNEPMAVYLGQKLAMQTGQIIPHEIASLVSQMLSYKRPLSEQFIEKCKDCLKVVGKIDRQFIYEFDKDYEHIFQRKHFVDYITQNLYDPHVDNRKYEDLIENTPRKFLEQPETRIYQESIATRLL